MKTYAETTADKVAVINMKTESTVEAERKRERGRSYPVMPSDALGSANRYT